MATQSKIAAQRRRDPATTAGRGESLAAVMVCDQQDCAASNDQNLWTVLGEVT